MARVTLAEADRFVFSKNEAWESVQFPRKAVFFFEVSEKKGKDENPLWIWCQDTESGWVNQTGGIKRTGPPVPHRVVGLCGSPREPTSERSSYCGWTWNPTALTLKGHPHNERGDRLLHYHRKERPIISLPSSAVRFWSQRRDKWKINPWSTNYLRVPLLLFNKCCNGWISHAKCTLHTNCMITPFWKLLSSATHQQGGWKRHYGRNCGGSSPASSTPENNGVFSSQEANSHMTLERKKEKNTTCFSRNCANALLSITELHWKSQGKDPLNDLSISLGFIPLEVPREQAKMKHTGAVVGNILLNQRQK